jgi:glycosyltransferase involved in cell wall biosynthesis
LYRSGQPSGETAVVLDDVAALRAAGIAVSELLPASDSIAHMHPVAKAGVALGPVYSLSGVKELKRLLENDRPNVVHLHNVFPLISPWVIRTAHAAGIPVVQTVHNYRHSCIAGTFFRDGGVCTLCEGRRIPSPGVVHACYRGSRAQSVAMATGAAVHRPTWRTVDRFFALTPFMKERLIAAGLPGERIVLRPTAAPDPGPPTPPGDDLLFVGRLDETKGVDLLLDAWELRQTTGATLRIAGSGPLLDRVTEAAARRHDIVVLGPLPASAVSHEMRAAAAVMVPSLLFEGLPRVVVEAFAHGRPVVTSTVGAVATVVDDSVGWRHAPDAHALAQTLDRVTGDPVEVATRGAAARANYQAEYTPERSLETMLETYRLLTGTT